MTREISVMPSCGNVFADLGLPEPELELRVANGLEVALAAYGVAIGEAHRAGRRHQDRAKDARAHAKGMREALKAFLRHEGQPQGPC